MILVHLAVRAKKDNTDEEDRVSRKVTILRWKSSRCVWSAHACCSSLFVTRKVWWRRNAWRKLGLSENIKGKMSVSLGKVFLDIVNALIKGPVPITSNCNGSHFDFCFEKERKKDEEDNERGRDRERRPPTRTVFFGDFCLTWAKQYLIISWTRVKRVSRIHRQKMVRWCIRLTCLTLACEVIRYRLVQVRHN